MIYRRLFRSRGIESTYGEAYSSGFTAWGCDGYGRPVQESPRGEKGLPEVRATKSRASEPQVRRTRSER